LEFDKELERTARRANSWNRIRKQKRTPPQEQIQESSSENPSPNPQSIHNFSNMENQPLRRTLGDYATQQGLWRCTNVAASSKNKVVEMKPAFLNLISARHEDDSGCFC